MRLRATALSASVVLGTALIGSGCGGEEAQDPAKERTPGAQTDQAPVVAGQRTPVARLLERALTGDGPHPLVTSAECGESPKRATASPPRYRRRLTELLFVCALANRREVSKYDVQVLENGCFTANRRGPTSEEGGSSKAISAIQACGAQAVVRAVEANAAE